MYQNSQYHSYHRWLSAVALMLLVLLILGIVLVSLGVFDPKPIGELVLTAPIEDIQEVDQLEVVSWLDLEAPSPNFSARLTGSWLSGEDDMGYGLVVGNPERYLIVAVSPLGYLSIWEAGTIIESPNRSDLIPWRTWPHIRTTDEQNEIWIDVQDNVVANVWINRELLAVEPISLSSRGFGTWSQSFGESAELRFDYLELFSE